MGRPSRGLARTAPCWWGRSVEVPVAVGVACPLSRPDCSGGPALTANGRSVFYFVGSSERFDPRSPRTLRSGQARRGRRFLSFARRSPRGRSSAATAITCSRSGLALDTTTRRVETLSVWMPRRPATMACTVLMSPPFAYLRPPFLDAVHSRRRHRPRPLGRRPLHGWRAVGRCLHGPRPGRRRRWHE